MKTYESNLLLKLKLLLGLRARPIDYNFTWPLRGLRGLCARFFLLALLPSSAWVGMAAPGLLANFTFEGTATDVAGDSPPMTLRNGTVTNGTLFLSATNDWIADATITGFSYNSFTVALDFY